ncbi:copper homeostasis membrane protein CopD [Bordetella flabilis]|uniref:Copper resistance protein CopD n=1 Tax=Bordetella flabilis TaxID=463014 RepID=A0A193GDZ1_9BORD|nr:copper homeostasis membrane protein CopD [Bordetella flabilis]ANN77833.1 copper resistance protein CopD [Bordetella flabilis]
MDGGLNATIRFALYLDLTLLAGLPLIAILAFRRQADQVATAIGLRGLLIALAGIGLVLSLCHMVMLAMVMSDVSELGDLERHVVLMMLTETDAGVAWAVRIAAMALVALSALLSTRQNTVSLGWAGALGIVSLATVAWSGHGAMDEGARRYVHFTADILHLIAAAGWIGALVTFALLLRPRQLAGLGQLRLLRQGLSGFAWIGTIIVLALVVTGVVNYCLIAGLQVSGLISTQYGQLLLTKLGLFALMLALAATNRYHLTPKLERSLGTGLTAQAVAGLRRSLAWETGAAILILAAVAWLGTLDPSQPAVMAPP